MEPTKPYIETHSEELKEVFGTPPRWLVRWGTVIACFSFIAMLMVAYFVKYPDVIKADLILSAPNPPVNLIADKTGLLDAVLVKDEQEVSEGELLLVYSSSANMLHIDTLAADLKRFSGKLSAEDIENFTPRRNLQLGGFQDEYSLFVKNVDAFNYGAFSQNDRKSINRLNAQIRDIENAIDIEESKKRGLVVRTRTAQSEFERLKKIYSSDVEKYGSEYRAAVKALNEVKREREDLDGRINSQNIQIRDKQKQIAEIRQKSDAYNSGLVLDITQNISDLKAKIKAWRNAHLLHAPIDGQVSFFQEFDNENQTVTDGTKILKIIPPGEVGEMYGKVDLPQAGSGKVEEQQEVIIKFDNYPFHEYGVIRGKVKNKSDIPQENNTYKVEVELIDGLKTSIGKKVSFSQGMQGTAEIKTKEKRFLFRIFENAFDF